MRIGQQYKATLALLLTTTAISSCSPHPPSIDARLYSIRVNPICIFSCDAETTGPLTVGENNDQKPEDR